MKNPLLLALLVLIVPLTARAAAGERLTYTPDVRKQSSAGDVLFHDLVSAPGGVAMLDEMAYPKARERQIVRIAAVVPFNNQRTGVERWKIEHSSAESASYIVTLIPDGKGGTQFQVQQDKGDAPPGVIANAGPKSSVNFRGTSYLLRASPGDQRQFTPQEQGDLATWADMIILGRYTVVRNGAALSGVANLILANYQKRPGAIVLGASTIPGKNGAPAEYFVAVAFGDPHMLEVDFSRFKMVDGVGGILAYQHRIYGEHVGDQMSAWLKANGAGFEADLRGWDGVVAPGSSPAR